MRCQRAVSWCDLYSIFDLAVVTLNLRYFPVCSLETISCRKLVFGIYTGWRLLHSLTCDIGTFFSQHKDILISVTTDNNICFVLCVLFPVTVVCLLTNRAINKFYSIITCSLLIDVVILLLKFLF